MLDPLSPQELKKLQNQYAKLASDEILIVFCMNRLLEIMKNEWNSGQMPSERHNELMPLKNDIESLLFQPPEKHTNIAQDILLKAEKIGSSSFCVDLASWPQRLKVWHLQQIFFKIKG